MTPTEKKLEKALFEQIALNRKLHEALTATEARLTSVENKLVTIEQHMRKERKYGPSQRPPVQAVNMRAVAEANRQYEEMHYRGTSSVGSGPVFYDSPEVPIHHRTTPSGLYS